MEKKIYAEKLEKSEKLTHDEVKSQSLTPFERFKQNHEKSIDPSNPLLNGRLPAIYVEIRKAQIEEEKNILADFYKDSKSRTEQRINELEESGYDVTNLRIKIEQKRKSSKSVKIKQKNKNDYGDLSEFYQDIDSFVYHKEYTGDLSKLKNEEVRYHVSEQASGLTRYGGKNNDHWATIELAKWIANTSFAWYSKYGNSSPIAINDISLLGGGKMPTYKDKTGKQKYHKSHMLGVDMDVKWQSITGKPVSGNFDSPSKVLSLYDFEKTVEMVQMFIDNLPEGFEIEKLFFGDYELIDYFTDLGNKNFEVKKNHSTHIHFRIKSKEVV